MDNLKPCPFCGKNRLTINFNDRSPNLFPFSAHVLCLNCLASVGAHGFEQTKAEAQARAVASWNRRAQPANEPITLNELRGMTDTDWVWLVFPEFPPEENGWHRAKRTYQTYSHEHYGKTWLAYRHKPEGGIVHVL